MTIKDLFVDTQKIIGKETIHRNFLRSPLLYGTFYTDMLVRINSPDVANDISRRRETCISTDGMTQKFRLTQAINIMEIQTDEEGNVKRIEPGKGFFVIRLESCSADKVITRHLIQGTNLNKRS